MRPFLFLPLLLVPSLDAAVGDPQLATDHLWYPAELAMSSLERLASTQAAQYERATGIKPADDHQESKPLNHRQTWQLPTASNVKTRWIEIAHP